MGWLINLGAKLSGMWDGAQDMLPLLGAAGGILAAGSTIASRAAGSANAADLVKNLHPNAQEVAEVSLAVGVIKQYFKHKEMEDNQQAASQATPVNADPNAPQGK